MVGRMKHVRASVPASPATANLWHRELYRAATRARIFPDHVNATAKSGKETQSRRQLSDRLEGKLISRSNKASRGDVHRSPRPIAPLARAPIRRDPYGRASKESPPGANRPRNALRLLP